MKTYTRDELIRKAARYKGSSDRSKKGGKSAKGRNGEERFLETESGRVRTLCYGMENAETLPLFVNIHGGGFILGHPEMDDPYMPRVAKEAGVKIISIDYDTAPEYPFPASVNQCYSVVKYAQGHADEFGIDPDRIAIGGHSAGGNFTAAVCLMNAERAELNIRAAILDYPPLDVYTDPADKPSGKGFVARVFLSPNMARFFDTCYCMDREGRKNPLISPVYATEEQLRPFPPTLILTAGKDSLCAEGERFRDMLVTAGVDVTHKRFEKSPHGFTLSDKEDAREGWRLMIEHLKSNL